MNPHDIRPSAYIAMLRECFREIAKPEHSLSAGEIIGIQKQINTCYEMTRELEEELDILGDIATPHRQPSPSRTHSATIIPLRRKPALQVIFGSPDGGDAA